MAKNKHALSLLSAVPNVDINIGGSIGLRFKGPVSKTDTIGSALAGDGGYASIPTQGTRSEIRFKPQQAIISKEGNVIGSINSQELLNAYGADVDPDDIWRNPYHGPEANWIVGVSGIEAIRNLARNRWSQNLSDTEIDDCLILVDYGGGTTASDLFIPGIVFSHLRPNDASWQYRILWDADKLSLYTGLDVRGSQVVSINQTLYSNKKYRIVSNVVTGNWELPGYLKPDGSPLNLNEVAGYIDGNFILKDSYYYGLPKEVSGWLTKDGSFSMLIDGEQFKGAMQSYYDEYENGRALTTEEQEALDKFDDMGYILYELYGQGANPPKPLWSAIPVYSKLSPSELPFTEGKTMQDAVNQVETIESSKSFIRTFVKESLGEVVAAWNGVNVSYTLGADELGYEEAKDVVGAGATFKDNNTSTAIDSSSMSDFEKQAAKLEVTEIKNLTLNRPPALSTYQALDENNPGLSWLFCHGSSDRDLYKLLANWFALSMHKAPITNA